jgi:hypothetical protein
MGYDVRHRARVAHLRLEDALRAVARQGSACPALDSIDFSCRASHATSAS